MERIVRTCCLLIFLSFAVGSTSEDFSVNKRILNYIKQHVNHIADPCEDFQNYAGGHFPDLHKDEQHYFMQSHIRYQYNGKLENLFDLLKDRVFIDENSVEEKVWRFYNTCLTAPIDTLTIKHYLELVSPGENLTWPQFVPHGTLWAKQQFQWLETVAHLRRYGANVFIRLTVEPDHRDSNTFSIQIKPPNLGLIKDLSQIEELLINSGVRSSRAAPLSKSIIKLNTDLQGLGDRLDKFEILSIEDFQNRTGLQLGKYLEIIVGYPVDSSSEIIAADLSYFEGLNGVIENYDREVVASYMMVQFFLIIQQLNHGDIVNEPKTCAATVAVQMELASDLLYKNYYLGQGKLEKYTQEIERIFEAVSRTFMARLEENRLSLTDDELSYIQQKLLAMTVKVGKLPNNVNHRRFVTNFYDDLDLDTDPDFAKALLKVLEHHTRKVLRQLDGPVPKGNSFILLEEDQYHQNPEPRWQAVQTFIFLPYCMLQEPFFVPESHDVFKMSLLGFSLTRAMLIPFWPVNLYYDSLSNYNDKLRDFTENEGYVNEMACLNRTTQPKDLQKRRNDVLSLELVYNTYFGENSEFSQTQPAFTKVPLKRLFLINFAQWFVGTEDFVNFGDNDPDKMRLSEAVGNLPSFGEVFNCPKTSLLNPPEKCEIW